MSEPSISPDRTRPSRPRGTRVWLVLAALITALWSFGASLHMNEADGLEGVTGGARVSYLTGAIVGGAIGQALVVAGLVWLVLYFGFTRRLARHRGASQFGILLLVAALAAAPLTGIKLYALASGASESGSVRTIMAADHARARAAGADLRAEQLRIMQGDPFSEAALIRPGGLQTARERLAQMRASLQRAETLGQANYDNTHRQLEALPLSNRRKAEILSAHVAGYEAGREDTRAALAAPAEVLNAVEAQLDILSRRPRGWVVQDGHIAFTNERDMNAFNVQARRFQAAQARAAEVASALSQQTGEPPTPQP
ncbi:MAG TPA: hypothetical protein VN018_06760 [Brevundimonas sp.]|nr:hypothetical protein [Brevundimonas sp.]